MVFYIPGVVLASREMKKGKDGGGGGGDSVNQQEERIWIWQRDCIYIMDLTP